MNSRHAPARSLTMLLVTFALALAAHAQDPVDVNSATREQLEGLPGVGAKGASEILREREENGPFASLDDLDQRVDAVTPAVLGKLRGLLRASAPDLVVVQEGKVVSNEAVRRVLQRYAGEPTVREVQARAIEYVRAHPEVIDSWQWRARVRAIAPKFSAEGQGSVDQDTRIVTNLDATAANITSDTNSQGGKVTLQASWDLDRLIFEPAEIQVAREAVRLNNLRDRVVEEVTRRYFERRRLQVDVDLSPPRELADRVKKELRLQELTADLDAATGGWFGEKLKAAGRSPY